jgi:hypothetical protein
MNSKLPDNLKGKRLNIVPAVTLEELAESGGITVTILLDSQTMEACLLEDLKWKDLLGEIVKTDCQSPGDTPLKRVRLSLSVDERRNVYLITDCGYVKKLTSETFDIAELPQICHESAQNAQQAKHRFLLDQQIINEIGAAGRSDLKQLSKEVEEKLQKIENTLRNMVELRDKLSLPELTNQE